MQQDDEHARSKPAGTLGGSAAAPTSRAGGTRECRETLEAGAVGMARAHLAVMLARPLLEGAALYPAAMARLYLPYISPISPSTPRQWRASVWRKSKPPRPGPPEQALPSPEAGRGAGGLRLAVARGSPCLAASGASRCSGGATGCWGRPSGGRTENLVEMRARGVPGFPNPATRLRVARQMTRDVSHRRACRRWPPPCSRTRWCCKRPASAVRMQTTGGSLPRPLCCGTR